MVKVKSKKHLKEKVPVIKTSKFKIKQEKTKSIPAKIVTKLKVIKEPQVTVEKLIEIKSENIEQALAGVLKFRSENPKLRNQLFDEQFPIFLQLSCFKIPRGHSKICRIPLKHSLYNSESEICLIVSEVKGIKNKEHDQHKEHYEKLLSDKGVNNIKTIMTFHEFRTEYESFEQKGRLVDLYDAFLADSKIGGKVVKKCGKIFYTKRKVPTSVKLQVTKLREHIDKSLSKTLLHLHFKGNSYTVQVGHSKMKIDELTDNVQSVTKFLEKDFPGGLNNIISIQVMAPRTTSIPVYVSPRKFDFFFVFKCILFISMSFTETGKDVAVPKIASNKPKAFKTYQGELTTFLDKDVVVKPSGQVFVKKIINNDNLPNQEVETKLVVEKSTTKPKSSQKLKGIIANSLPEVMANTYKKPKRKSGEINGVLSKQSKSVIVNPIQEIKEKTSKKSRKTVIQIDSGLDEMKEHVDVIPKIKEKTSNKLKQKLGETNVKLNKQSESVIVNPIHKIKEKASKRSKKKLIETNMGLNKQSKSVVVDRVQKIREKPKKNVSQTHHRLAEKQKHIVDSIPGISEKIKTSKRKLIHTNKELTAKLKKMTTIRIGSGYIEEEIIPSGLRLGDEVVMSMKNDNAKETKKKNNLTDKSKKVKRNVNSKKIKQ